MNRLNEPSSITVTLPSMSEGQADWKMYREYQYPIGRASWKWHHRVTWRLVMFFHDKTERAWHWLWRTAQRFAEPPMNYETRYAEVIKQDGSTVTVKSCDGISNGDSLYSSIPKDVKK